MTGGRAPGPPREGDGGCKEGSGGPGGGGAHGTRRSQGRSPAQRAARQAVRRRRSLAQNLLTPARPPGSKDRFEIKVPLKEPYTDPGLVTNPVLLHVTKFVLTNQMEVAPSATLILLPFCFCNSPLPTYLPTRLPTLTYLP